MSDDSIWDSRFREASWPTDPDPLLVEMAAALTPGRAADLGCGPGRHAIWLAQQGWRVTGVDSSQVGLDQARARAEQLGLSLELVRADLAEFQSPQPFDLVLLANIHPDPEARAQLFAQATQVVAPGGHLLIFGHHLDDLGRSGPPDPSRLFTPERLRESLPEGLSLLRMDRVERWPEGRQQRPDVAMVAWLERPLGASGSPPSIP